MKKFLSALLAAVLLLSATACAAHEPVLPPSRWGEGEAKGMLPHTYSLSEAYDAAEVVALVTVGDWLEEELITGRTFFRTTVQKVYKGDIPHEFVLAQEGCSTWTYRNYPVFTYVPYKIGKLQIQGFSEPITSKKIKQSYHITQKAARSRQRAAFLRGKLGRRQKFSKK